MAKKTERREYTFTNGRSEMGRSIIYIDCPFCGSTVRAYLWSIAGVGKKCYCGAIHYRPGGSVKEIVGD